MDEKWEKVVCNDGRYVYYNNSNQTCHWLPPKEIIESSMSQSSSFSSNCSLPYGFEKAQNQDGSFYFINHLEQTTSTTAPSLDISYFANDREPRTIKITKDARMGFGFVAGSEKPVVVRCVNEDGPSHGKLLAGDEILQVNGITVVDIERESVIKLVKSCTSQLVMIVCQPNADNSERKSAILTIEKKVKLKNNPSKVRFDEDTLCKQSCTMDNKSMDDLMPNVLKVFLENGQTKSFKYDDTTTVEDVLLSMRSKLEMKSHIYFNLTLQNLSTSPHNKLNLLLNTERLIDIASLPSSAYFRCLYRICYLPGSISDLLKNDCLAFEYFYMQCCNDIVEDRFTSDMKIEIALKLASIQMKEYAISSLHCKSSLKNLIKDPGINNFLSPTILSQIKPRFIIRALQNHYRQVDKSKNALKLKIEYLKIISEFKSYGNRYYIATHLQKKSEIMICVNHKNGIHQIVNIKNNTKMELANFAHLEKIFVKSFNQGMLKVTLKLIKPFSITISLLMLIEDGKDFISLISGYYAMLVDRHKDLVIEDTSSDVPKYHSIHMVAPSPWTYVSATPMLAVNIMRQLDLRTGAASNVRCSSPKKVYELPKEVQSKDVIFASLMDSENKSIEVKSELDYRNIRDLEDDDLCSSDSIISQHEDLNSKASIKPLQSIITDDPYSNYTLSLPILSRIQNAPLASPDISTISSSESSEPDISSSRPSTLQLLQNSTSDSNLRLLPPTTNTLQLPNNSLNISSCNNDEDTISNCSNMTDFNDLPIDIRKHIDSMVNCNGEMQFEELDKIMQGQDAENDSGNETISGENIELNSGIYQPVKLPMALDMLDIDSFIAAMSIPPPPEHFRTIANNKQLPNISTNVQQSSIKPVVKSKPHISHLPINIGSDYESPAVVKEDTAVPLWKQLLTPTSSPTNELVTPIESQLNNIKVLKHSSSSSINCDTKQDKHYVASSTPTHCSTMPRLSVKMREKTSNEAIYQLPPPPEEIREARGRHKAPLPPRRHSSLESEFRNKPVPPPRRGSKLLKNSDIIYDRPQLNQSLSSTSSPTPVISMYQNGYASVKIRKNRSRSIDRRKFSSFFADDEDNISNISMTSSLTSHDSGEEIWHKRSSSLDTRKYNTDNRSRTRTSIIANIIERSTEDGAVIKACRDVDRLISDLARAMSSPSATRPLDDNQSINELSRLSRQFVGDSKTLVSGATKNRKSLIYALSPSSVTLHMIVNCSRGLNVTRHRRAGHQSLTAAVLLALVKDVASAYRETLRSADLAAGLELTDPAMKTLMRRATELASSLSHLMKTLKSFKSVIF